MKVPSTGLRSLTFVPSTRMNSLIEKFSLLTVIKYEEMVALGFEVFDKELPSTLLKKVHVIVKTITEIVNNNYEH